MVGKELELNLRQPFESYVSIFDHYAALLSFKQQEVRQLLQKTTKSSYHYNDTLRGHLEGKSESLKSVKSYSFNRRKISLQK